MLTKQPSDLTIWEVIDAVEPFKRIRECPLDIGSHEGTLCPLHRRLDNAMAMVEDSFRETTIAELLSQPDSVTPLCERNPALSIDLSQVPAAQPTAAPKKRTKRKKKRS